MKPDLLAEMDYAASNVRAAHFERLASLGVSATAIGKLGQFQHTIGAIHVREEGNGLFEPDPGGFGACIVAVVDPYADLGDAGLFDLVAFRAERPDRWWCRTGTAFALGEDMLDGLDPVEVVRSPADWLSAAGEAVCILDWSDNSPAWPALRAGPPLTFPDDTLRQQVRTALVRSVSLPSMEIRYAA